MPRRLVILCPGWTKPGIAYVPLAHKFKEKGYHVIRAWYPGRGFGPIEHSSKAAFNLVEAARSEFDHITWVGHSMGGLIGRHLIQQWQSPIDSYISLGTPHQGTYSAYLAPWSASATQMRPGSTFLEDLDQKSWPAIPTLALQAGLEEIVLPRNYAEFKHAENITVPGATHGSIIFNAQAFWEMWSWLTYVVFGESTSMKSEGFISQAHAV